MTIRAGRAAENDYEDDDEDESVARMPDAWVRNYGCGADNERDNECDSERAPWIA